MTANPPTTANGIAASPRTCPTRPNVWSTGPTDASRTQAASRSCRYVRSAAARIACAPSARESPEACRVLAHDLPPLVVGHVDEQRVDHAAGVRPVVPVVREVRRPRHVLDAHLVADRDAVVVDDEGREHVVLEVLARHLLRVGLRPVPVPPVAVV